MVCEVIIQHDDDDDHHHHLYLYDEDYQDTHRSVKGERQLAAGRTGQLGRRVWGGGTTSINAMMMMNRVMLMLMMGMMVMMLSVGASGMGRWEIDFGDASLRLIVGPIIVIIVK